MPLPAIAMTLPEHTDPMSAHQAWPRRAAEPDLLSRGIHIWRVNLMIAPPIEDELANLLDSAERGRAARFRFAADRRRFVASHGALRLLLGQLIDAAPQAVELVAGEYGKPELDPRHAPRLVQFNLAHSGELALIAVGREAAIGVDLEHVRPIPEVMDIAKRFYSPSEQQRLATVAGTSLEQLSFYTCWTRKEAIIKGLGHGLYHPTPSFSVTFLPDEPVAILGDEAPGAPLLRWTLHALQPGDGYVGAVAAAAPAPVHCWSWSW